MKRLIIMLLCLGFCGVVHAAEPADSVTVVRSLLDESSASFWSDAELQEWLDNGISDIAARVGCIEDSDTFLLVTSQYEYTDLVTNGAAAVANATKVWGCIYINPDDEYIGLKRVEPRQIADLPHMKPGPPVYYYHYDDKIGIFPLPTSGQNGDSVKIYFSKNPSAATLELRIAELPSEYHNAMYWFCASMAYKKEHRYAESDKFYQMYIEALNALKQELYDVPTEQKTP
jgi:hypothetical protein